MSSESGSIIAVIAIDAPVSSLSLRQIAKRAAIGVGRGGSPGGNNSGDIFLSFSTQKLSILGEKSEVVNNRLELNPDFIDPLYLAAVECVEEAVVNALVAGESVPTFKPSGLTCKSIDLEFLKGIFDHN